MNLCNVASRRSQKLWIRNHQGPQYIQFWLACFVRPHLHDVVLLARFTLLSTQEFREHREELPPSQLSEFSSKTLPSPFVLSSRSFINFRVMVRSQRPAARNRRPRNSKISSAKQDAKKIGGLLKKGVKKSYMINGQKIFTTENFDLFWQYAAERKSIYDKRVRGEPAPSVFADLPDSSIKRLTSCEVGHMTLFFEPVVSATPFASPTLHVNF